MNTFHFLRPEWFFAIIPLLLLIFFLKHIRSHNRGWQSYCDQKLLPYLLTEKTVQKNRHLLSLLLAGGLLVITSLAGPTWEQRPMPVFKKQSALVIILDLSLSMDAADIKPNRLTRAKHKVLDILKARSEGQTALVVFAGEAFSVTPLTDDTETIASQVNSLSTDIMPTQGSNSAAALKMALNLLEQASQLNGDILLITDGINSESLQQVKDVRAKGHRVSVLAIGTTEGAPIPQPGGGFVKDASGSIVIPAVNFSSLAEIAALGGGVMKTLTTNDDDINALLAPLNRLDFSDDSKATELNTDTWYETGPYLLLLVIPLAAFAFRRGYIVALALFVLPGMPQPAHALELWKNQNQQARDLLNNNDAANAAEKFTDPAWKAAALYKAGQYKKALDLYNQVQQPDTETLYNKANTLAQLGQLDDAIKTYDDVLTKNPQHADAKYNRDVLKKQQQQQSQQDKSENKNGKDNKPDNNDTKQDDSSSGDKQQNDNDQQNPDHKQTNKESSDNNEQNAQNGDSQKQANDKPNNQPEDNQAQGTQSKDQQIQDEQQAAQSAEQQKPQQPPEKNAQAITPEDSPGTEQQQATEQWLRRIPDDPGGLLKRKFLYQSERRQHDSANNGQQQW